MSMMNPQGQGSMTPPVQSHDPMMAQGAPSPVKPEGDADKEAIKQQLIGLFKQGQKVAQANGLDFYEIISEVEGNKVKASATLPRPPRTGLEQTP